MGRRARALALCAAICGAALLGQEGVAAAGAGTPVPDGGEFVIASLDYSTGRGAAVDEDGNYLVLWYQFFGGYSGRGYSAAGTPDSGFNVEPYGPNATFDPMDVANLGGDDFAIVWEDAFEGLRGRRYRRDGTPLAPFFEIAGSQGGTLAHVEPAVARWRPSSGLLAVWASTDPAGGGDDDGFGILLRALDPGGSGGPPFAVNTYTTGNQGAPEIESAPDGSVLVVWESAGSPGDDGSGRSVQGRWFPAVGPPGPQFQVNTHTPADQRRPAVAMAPDGSALVAWDGPSAGDDTDKSIQGRLVDAQGSPVGSDFQINTTILGLQFEPAVAPRRGGGFHVAWRDSTGVFVQAVAADGSLLGSEVMVNTSENESYGPPALAGGALGRFLVAWTDDIGPFRGQRFREGVFADGFESGDTAAWSTTVP
ncbi:MAG: hypothetical protein OES32_01780 [Acidobacteriota bacterium]|nr:hypothetical protein [Acidobacteriota bacterium]MDH3522289.1 hypothetical protein [Acidobacteriota bacterium]